MKGFRVGDILIGRNFDIIRYYIVHESPLGLIRVIELQKRILYQIGLRIRKPVYRDLQPDY